MSQIANLLDLDPHLRGRIGAEARRLLDVRVLEVPPGRWQAEALTLDGQAVGLLVVEGLLARRVWAGARASAELLGHGDLLRPWILPEPPLTADWRVLEPLRLAVLDAAVAERLTRVPTVLLTLLEREVHRSRRMAERCAIAQLPSTEARLHIELRRLADRWGRPHPRGTALPLPLTHEVLGHLIGTRRQSVTTALSRMTQERRIEPLPGAGWLLRDDATPPVMVAGTHVEPRAALP